jgi:hypothetical protein
MPLPFCEVYQMDKKDKYRERIPIAQWPELDRKMAIIARMTSDPPINERQDEVLSGIEEMDTLSLFSGDLTEKDVPIG